MVSNERIDLTQFEDIPKQMEIKWHEHPTYGARYLIQISEPETPWVVGAVVPDFELYDDYAKNKIEQEKMAKLFAATPDLIAELKKMYTREDELLSALRIVRDDLDNALETEGYGSIAHEKSNRTLQKIRNFANDASQ